jgi:hypothetical protein
MAVEHGQVLAEIDSVTAAGTGGFRIARGVCYRCPRRRPSPPAEEGDEGGVGLGQAHSGGVGDHDPLAAAELDVDRPAAVVGEQERETVDRQRDERCSSGR